MGPLLSFDKADKRFTYTMDVVASARIVFSKKGHKQLINLVPELGYTYEYRGLHLAHLGLGLGYGTFFGGWAYVPRFVIGSERRRAVPGFRHSLVFETLAGGIWIELSHQILSRESGVMNDLRLLMGIDVLRAIFAVFHLGAALGR